MLNLLTRRRITGRENIPNQGPLLVVSNHLNMLDPPLLGLSLGRRVKFIAKEELFQSRIVGYLVGSLGAFPVSRRRPNKKTLSQAVQVLADGQALVIFPEGMRSRGGRLRAAFPGAALIASRSGAPILPVGITGTERIRGVAWWLCRPQITVNIGQPFHLPPGNDKLTKIELAQLTDIIMGRIAELLPLEYRGHYADEGIKCR